MPNWIVQLNNLHVVNANEEPSKFSLWHVINPGGDEIYMVVISFRSRLGVPGSTKVGLNDYHSHAWSDGALANDTKAIPAGQGLTTFENVDDFTITNVLDGKTDPDNPVNHPEVLGIVSLAMESDDTPWSAIDGIVSKARDVIHDQLETIIAGEKTSLMKLTAAQLGAKLAAASGEIKAAVTPNLLGKLELLAESASDPDDLIGYTVNWFTNLNPDLVACLQSTAEHKANHDTGAPLPADQSNEALVRRSGLRPLRSVTFVNDYKDGDTEYTVAGSVRNA